MGNALHPEVDSVDFRPGSTWTDPEDELRTSLATFMLLYDQCKGCLQSGSQSLSADLGVFPCVFSFPGGVLGGACGGIIGVPGGAIGAIAAATYARLFGKINAVGATVGFFGSVLGGVVGGTFSGCVGGAVGGADKAWSNSHGVWFTIGLVTGGAIGSIYGGNIGAAGGAFGGGLGAFCGSRFAVCLVGGFAGGTKDSTEKTEKVQKAADEFNRTIKVLVQELKMIQLISNQMSFDAQLQRVAAQTEKTLNAVKAMKETDPRRFPDRAERRSREVTEELKTMRTEAAKLLSSFTKSCS